MASKWVTVTANTTKLVYMDDPAHHHPTVTTQEFLAKIESMRRTRKWSASRLKFELCTDGIIIARRTVTKIL